MNILLTGANGYIGLRLLPTLLEEGHQITAVVRTIERFPAKLFESFVDSGQLSFLEADFLGELPPVPEGIDAAYYLLHSMGADDGFSEKEERCARNFLGWIKAKQVVYLSGLVPKGKLSPHLASRERVNEILRTGLVPVTTLRASIIVGSGSASFEIIRDLAEKLPFMITPKWTATLCQPIAIRNVIGYLTGVLTKDETLGKEFDIGGPEVLSYRDLLLRYAEARGLKRFIIPVPFFSPGLSARWLYLVTATSYPLAQSLVNSLVNETICRDHSIEKLIPQELLSYEESIEKAFVRIAQNRVPSSWYDSLASGKFEPAFLSSVQVPAHGILRDEQNVPFVEDREDVINAVWSLGGKKGWPSMNWAWRLRGLMDRLTGGIGLRRGRRHPTELNNGDALDFWRVVLADRESNPESARLILAAEMKMPGEAWLEFEITETSLRQTATFRPRGLFGRVYWYSVLPLHLLLFPRMAKKLAQGKSE
ncbi:SDR family oxidoreductase [Akkermansiaceae bacterium]|nr:SDR family oxidoreductase [bacterium]MDB4615313.1 SDR family oxidoreductase [Akkermansiaceae bacterium]MDB4667747.1 SDR family oxidoreductase [Akkermansiaceae bacterium]